ncbi:VCBS repeat-containing protein [Streptomyces sp. NBC_01465]|uniref:VCBS repeat-containing protein n=1 Tax=Streptomyces sp. NBC_01465 TaxID=2903878 RepID=UPI002E2FA04C|nr:FG-GAP-like repeat-containing protein [Streptomyces sp. NBC_01465]
MNKRRTRLSVLAVGVVGGLVGLLAVGGTGTASAAPAVKASVQDDFNGDGYADLAVSGTRGTVSGLADAGYAAVMYGGPHGLSTTSRVVISRATTGIPGNPEEGVGFGYALSHGDLDGDGYADLVISGIGGEDSVIVWGSPSGLSSGTSVPNYRSLSQVGDFNGDGKTDVALFRTTHAGHDDPSGTQSVIWYGPISRAGKPTRTAAFGDDSISATEIQSASSGDVDHDGYADLAVGAYSGEGTDSTYLLYGSATGLAKKSDGPTYWANGTAALGDVNGDGFDDFVAGDVNGAVQVAYGSTSGLGTAVKRIDQNSPGVPGANEGADGFGSSIAVGDVTGDGIDDVAVGAPGEAIGTIADTGAVTLLKGSKSGLSGTGSQAFNQDTAAVPGAAEKGDRFGYAVHLVDINGNGYADLAASAAGEDAWNGAAWLLRGRPEGITTDAALLFGPKGIGAPATKTWFGYVLG